MGAVVKLFPGAAIDLSATGMATRAELALSASAPSGESGYSAGYRSWALRNWRPIAGSANADTIYDIPDLRAKNRALRRNDPIAAAIFNVTVGGSIGSGLTMQPAVDREFLGLSDEEADAWEANTQRRWELWAESVQCDAERKQNFYGLQATVEPSSLESGDVFVLYPSLPRRGSDNTLAVQVIEADRVSVPTGKTNSDTHCEGIDFDPDTGEPIRAWICNVHPGEINTSGIRKWTPVEFFGEKTGRRNLVQIFGTPDTLRPGQARGVPLLAPIIEQLKQLSRYRDAELQAAINGAIFGMFTEMEAQAFSDLFDSNDAWGKTPEAIAANKNAFLQSRLNWDGNIHSSRAINLLPGERIHDVKPNHPNSGLGPFQETILTAAAAAVGVPYEVMMLRFNASFSASRAAVLIAWQTFQRRRYNTAFYFCQPTYENWLAEEIAMGKIRAPGFFTSDEIRRAWSAANWIGDAPPEIDPDKAVDAAIKRMSASITTLEEETMAFNGRSFRQRYKTMVKERQMLAEGGLLSEKPVSLSATMSPGNENTDSNDQP